MLQRERPGRVRASSAQLAFDVTEISSGFQDHLGQAVLQPRLPPRDPSFPITKVASDPASVTEGVEGSWDSRAFCTVRQIPLGVHYKSQGSLSHIGRTERDELSSVLLHKEKGPSAEPKIQQAAHTHYI